MSRILLPLLLGTTAFSIAWWAGSSRLGGTADNLPAVQSSAVPALMPSPPANTSSLTGLARRSAQLQRTEKPPIQHIATLISEPGVDSMEVFRLVGIWAEQDPAGLQAWLQKEGKAKLPNQNFSSQVFASWFRLDPATAMAKMREIDPKDREYAAHGILANLTGKEAADRLKLLPYLDEVVEASGQAIRFSSKPADTAAILTTLPPGKGKDTLMQALGKSWVESDWKAATGWAAGQSEPIKSKLIADMAEAAFRLVPESMKSLGMASSHSEAECFDWAKQWFTSEATPDLKRRMSTQFVRKLASTDPSGALDWAQDNLSAYPLTQAMGTILKQQASKDPAAARTLVEGLPPGGMKDRVAFEIAGAPSKETVAWLLKEVDQDPNYQWSRFASDWAFRDPAAYRALLESGADAKLPKGLAEGGLANLMAKDGPGTMDWAMRTQPPSSVTQALSRWTEKNAAAAVDWVLQRPPGVARDEAVATVRKSLEYHNMPQSERRALLGRLGKQ